MQTKGISEKHFKTKDLDTNNHYEDPTKHIFCLLKKYQKNILKSNIKILTITII